MGSDPFAWVDQRRDRCGGLVFLCPRSTASRRGAERDSGSAPGVRRHDGGSPCGHPPYAILRNPPTPCADVSARHTRRTAPPCRPHWPCVAVGLRLGHDWGSQDRRLRRVAGQPARHPGQSACPSQDRAPRRREPRRRGARWRRRVGAADQLRPRLPGLFQAARAADHHSPGGRDKNTQAKDIKAALRLSRHLSE